MSGTSNLRTNVWQSCEGAAKAACRHEQQAPAAIAPDGSLRLHDCSEQLEGSMAGCGRADGAKACGQQKLRATARNKFAVLDRELWSFCAAWRPLRDPLL